jgi:xylitol oxidase
VTADRGPGAGIGTNWAGNHAYRAAALARPSCVEEVRDLVARSSAVRAIGSRHSFSDLTDTTGTLVDLGALPVDLRLDPAARTVSVSGGVRYGELAAALEEQGWALAAMASLPHISVAGAVATGTHGSGDRSQSLAAAVRSLEVVGADGALRRVTRGEPDFDGSVVALGALGVVTRLELDVEPTYAMSQEVRTGLSWPVLEQHFDDITAAAYSVSLFTHFEDGVDQVWLKHRTAAGEPAAALFGTVAAQRTMHMLRGGSAEAVTTQGGAPGAWLDRLPHFRLAFTPSNGAELQSEYFVAREHALAAIEQLRRMSSRLAPLLEVAEIRTIAADELWLSGAHRRDTVGLHFTWVRDEPAVRRVVREIEQALVPLGARPHWGKVFEMDAGTLADAFPRLPDFAALRDRVDPERVFGNGFLDRVLPPG